MQYYGVTVENNKKMKILCSHSPIFLFNEMKCVAVFITESDAVSYSFEQSGVLKLEFDRNIIHCV